MLAQPPQMQNHIYSVPLMYVTPYLQLSATTPARSRSAEVSLKDSVGVAGIWDPRSLWDAPDSGSGLL